MIVTEVFLLFVAVPLVCAAEETTELPKGCRLVGDSVFQNALCTENLRNFLGDYCQETFADRGTRGQWIGDVGTRIGDCNVCCIRRFENGTKTYDLTRAPNTLPCGPKKTCQNGNCRPKPSSSGTRA
uniref:Putative ixostatin n=1 Tax=Ixodes ricinus TaxID=34613 RepID=A0A0K8R3R8_IXORI